MKDLKFPFFAFLLPVYVHSLKDASSFCSAYVLCRLVQKASWSLFCLQQWMETISNSEISIQLSPKVPRYPIM